MRFFLTAILFMGLTASATAQDSTDVVQADSTLPDPIVAESEPYVLGVGLQFGIYGGSISTEDPPEGRKVNPDFWFLPTYGAVIYAPFTNSSKIGGRLDVGIVTTGTRNRPYENYFSKTN